MPPFTVASFATTTHSMPSMMPMPVTMPRPGVAVVEAVGGKGRQLEEGGARVDEALDALADRELAALAVAGDRAIVATGAPGGEARGAIAKLGHELAHRGCVRAERVGARVEGGAEDGHGARLSPLRCYPRTRMATDARRILLERLIDDAGLFPPARLPMDEALAAHAANRFGPAAWIQGRFVCPASRLMEIGAAWPDGLSSIRLAVVCDGAGAADALGFSAALAADLADAALIERGRRPMRVELIEARLPAPDAAGELTAAVRQADFTAAVAAMAEAPDSTEADSLRETVAAVAAARDAGASRLGAKIRCGGLDAELFPSAAALAAFLAAAVVGGVPFKATAGLHHPVRGIDATSGFRMHGFVNLLVAAALLRAGAIDESGAARVLDDEDPGSFVVTPERIGWRDRVIEAAALGSVREEALTAYGSCSFDEPTADLAALGWLP